MSNEKKDAVCKSYGNKNFYDPSILKNIADIDFNDVKLKIKKIVKINYNPAVDSHLTTIKHVVNAIDEKSLVCNNKDNDFSTHDLANIKSNSLKSQAVNYNDGHTKSYADQFKQVNEQSRRGVGLDFFDKSSDLVTHFRDHGFNDN